MSIVSLQRKICLGTVQLGLNYGINNHTGRPGVEEAFAILSAAARHQINLLDSAEGYGTSLEVIGSFLTKNPSTRFQVISKFIGSSSEASLNDRVTKTLSDLGIPVLYGYMYHRYEEFESGIYSAMLLRLKQEGKISRVGVSVYTTDQLEKAITDSGIDIIQVPFNPFDASERKLDLIRSSRELKKEIHVRSIFLQGLFFKDPSSLTGNLKPLSAALSIFKEWRESFQLTTEQACLNFALHKSDIDRVLIGVETADQLNNNVAAILPLDAAVSFEDLNRELSAKSIDPFLLNPGNWKL